VPVDAADFVCDPPFGPTAVAPGDSMATKPLSAGTHLFQCIIHPWMRTVATVEGDDRSGSGHSG
jgi:hypothetical protein